MKIWKQTGHCIKCGAPIYAHEDSHGASTDFPAVRPSCLCVQLKSYPAPEKDPAPVQTTPLYDKDFWKKIEEIWRTTPLFTPYPNHIWIDPSSVPTPWPWSPFYDLTPKITQTPPVTTVTTTGTAPGYIYVPHCVTGTPVNLTHKAPSPCGCTNGCKSNICENL